uniref:DUF7044 domain-containing protein n=1 Tax=Strigamia maritima TaxID=126957 RepID=T1IKH9_STRMM
MPDNSKSNQGAGKFEFSGMPDKVSITFYSTNSIFTACRKNDQMSDLQNLVKLGFSGMPFFPREYVINSIEDSECRFPDSWSGVWFQSEMQHLIKIQAGTMSLKGKCVAMEGDKFLLEDMREGEYLSRFLKNLASHCCVFSFLQRQTYLSLVRDIVGCCWQDAVSDVTVGILHVKYLVYLSKTGQTRDYPQAVVSEAIRVFGKEISCCAAMWRLNKMKFNAGDTLGANRANRGVLQFLIRLFPVKIAFCQAILKVHAAISVAATTLAHFHGLRAKANKVLREKDHTLLSCGNFSLVLTTEAVRR